MPFNVRFRYTIKDNFTRYPVSAILIHDHIIRTLALFFIAGYVNFHKINTKQGDIHKNSKDTIKL